MQLTKGYYWRYNPDNTKSYIEIQNDEEQRYHQDLLDTKGYTYEQTK